MTFRQVTEEEPGYIRWMKSLPDPGEKMSCLLHWVNSIDRYQKVWSEHGRDINRIAKYFQVDLCKGCGCMGTVRNGTESSSEFDSDDDSEIEGVELYPCHRTKWPNVTPIPSYEKAMKNINPLDSRERHRAWREAWDFAEQDGKINGQSACANDDLLCSKCICDSSNACRFCVSWECKQCKKDTKTCSILERWYEADPRVEEDEYGRRDENPYQNLQAHPCLGCRRRICHRCSTECQDCHRRACDKCKNEDDLRSWCADCRHAYEEVDDFDIGPVNREVWICRPCFESTPHYCECGEPSYDPGRNTVRYLDINEL